MGFCPEGVTFWIHFIQRGLALRGYILSVLSVRGYVLHFIIIRAFSVRGSGSDSLIPRWKNSLMEKDAEIL